MSESWRDVVGAWACCGLIAVGAVALLSLSGGPSRPDFAAAPDVIAPAGDAIAALDELAHAMAAMPGEKICPPWRRSNVVASVNPKAGAER